MTWCCFPTRGGGNRDFTFVDLNQAAVAASVLGIISSSREPERSSSVC